MLKLKSFAPDGEAIIATYEVSHEPAKGSKGAACSALPLTLAITKEGAEANVDFTGFPAETEDLALDALADALEAAAAGIRSRGKANLAVPVFG